MPFSSYPAWLVCGTGNTATWAKIGPQGSLPTTTMLSDNKPSGPSWHTVTINVPFASPKHALLAKQVIEVDSELQPDVAKRNLSVEGEILVARFDTTTVRLARLTTNGFLENIDLVIRTLERFGEDAEKKS